MGLGFNFVQAHYFTIFFICECFLFSLAGERSAQEKVASTKINQIIEK